MNGRGLSRVQIRWRSSFCFLCNACIYGAVEIGWSREWEAMEGGGGSDIRRGAAEVTAERRSTVMCYSRHIFRQRVGIVKQLDKSILRWSYCM
jgi:hypothetical protein